MIRFFFVPEIFPAAVAFYEKGFPFYCGMLYI